MEDYLDIIFSSCARPKLLEESVSSAKQFLKSDKQLRFILVEDLVINKERKEKGLNWIKNNKDKFFKINLLEKKAGFGWHFQEVVKESNSEYFFRMEDDQLFKRNIYLDPLLEIMKSNSNLVSISLRRDIDRRKDKKKLIINDIALAETNFFSDSLGLFNTKLTKRLIDHVGWENQLHENGVMTPASNNLKLDKYLLGWRKRISRKYPIHYFHNGKKNRQGSYSEEFIS